MASKYYSIRGDYLLDGSYLDGRGLICVCHDGGDWFWVEAPWDGSRDRPFWVERWNDGLILCGESFAWQFMPDNGECERVGIPVVDMRPVRE